MQDVLDVLFERCPELVVRSITDRGAGGVGAARRTCGPSPARGPATGSDLRGDADSAAGGALHVDVIDPVSVQIRGIRHDDQVRAVQLPAHVDLPGYA